MKLHILDFSEKGQVAFRVKVLSLDILIKYMLMELVLSHSGLPCLKGHTGPIANLSWSY